MNTEKKNKEIVRDFFHFDELNFERFRACDEDLLSSV